MLTNLLRTSAAFATALGLPLTAHAQLAAFQGSPGGVGSVWVIDPTGVAAPTPVAPLTGITLLPIECAGRTAINSFADNRARFWDDVPGASRLALPGGGSLYAYRRAAAAGEYYGYFVITATGQVRRLIEFLSNSPGQSPFVDRVAVSPDGAHVLVATQSFAGGDLYEIAVGNGLVTARTGSLPPQNFEGAGIALMGAWGAAVGTNGLLRFERTTGAQAQAVAVGNATPDAIARELVSTFNGLYCAALAVDESGLTYPVVFGRTGTARRVGDGLYPTAGVGLAPDAVHGPWLTVSEDGQWCAWRTTNGHYWGYEAWLAPVPWADAASSSLHVTQPALFDDYIDEIGDFFFSSTGRFILAAGDRSLNINGLEKSDIYSVALPSAVSNLTGALPLVENLTGTSGESSAPFFYYGELVVERAVATPDGSQLFVIAKDEQENGDPVKRSLFSVDGSSTSPVVIQDEFTTLDYFDVAGGQLILSATFVNDPADNGLSSVEAGATTSLQELHLFGQTRGFQRGLSRDDGQTLYVLSNAAGEQLWRARTGQLPVRMSPRELQYGPTLAFTPSGDAACTVQSGSAAMYVVWSQAGTIRRVKGPAGAGFLLPAN